MCRSVLGGDTRKICAPSCVSISNDKIPWHPEETVRVATIPLSSDYYISHGARVLLAETTSVQRCSDAGPDLCQGDSHWNVVS